MKTKEPKCKFCEGKHYQTFCPRKPRKPIAVHKPLRASLKPLKAKKPLPSGMKRKPIKKRTKLKVKSNSQRAILTRKLDRVFSIFIRLRLARDGYAICVTCGDRKPWREMQNGHYVSRRKMSVRWDEMNCHVQCSHCNETLNGNLSVYKVFMINTYGEEAYSRLMERASKPRKLSIDELENKIKHYEALVARMAS